MLGPYIYLFIYLLLYMNCYDVHLVIHLLTAVGHVVRIYGAAARVGSAAREWPAGSRPAVRSRRRRLCLPLLLVEATRVCA